MKYLLSKIDYVKTFETSDYNTESTYDLRKFEEIFYELQDISYNIVVRTAQDFILPDVLGNSINQINGNDIISENGKKYKAKRCVSIYVAINKISDKWIADTNLFSPIRGFNKSEVQETIEFAIRYCVELGYELNYIQYTKIGNIVGRSFTKNIDLVDDKLYKVVLSFIKVY
jgi:hypothetical protein